MNKLYKAYSLVELIIVVLFIGILAAIAVPRIDFAIVSKQKVDTVAQKITTDLRRTRRLAISDAASNTQGFALRLTGVGSYNQYLIRDLSKGIVIDSHTIDSSITCTANGTRFIFGPMGNQDISLFDTGTKIMVSAQGRSFTITVVPATGMVKCVEN